MCECWWDLPRSIKELFWPRSGLELCLGWRVSLCAFTTFLVDKCPRRSECGGQKTHNYSQSSFSPWHVLSKNKLWLMSMFQRRTWELSLGVKVLTQWAGKQFLGEWICLKSLNSNKQHSCYMVWLATKTSRLFCGLEYTSVLGTVSKNMFLFIWTLGCICEIT